jgi:hypothetical protein
MHSCIHTRRHRRRICRNNRSLLIMFPWILIILTCITWGSEAALVELRQGPVAAMAVHIETEWPTVNLFAGGGLAIPGYVGSPLRNPSLSTGFRIFTGRGGAVRPYLTGMYGWTLRSEGMQPFAGGGGGLAWRFGPGKNYRLSAEAAMVLRDTLLPYPSAGFGLAVRM